MTYAIHIETIETPCQRDMRLRREIELLDFNDKFAVFSWQGVTWLIRFNRGEVWDYEELTDYEKFSIIIKNFNRKERENV